MSDPANEASTGLDGAQTTAPAAAPAAAPAVAPETKTPAAGPTLEEFTRLQAQLSALEGKIPSSDAIAASLRKDPAFKMQQTQMIEHQVRKQLEKEKAEKLALVKQAVKDGKLDKDSLDEYAEQLDQQNEAQFQQRVDAALRETDPAAAAPAYRQPPGPANAQAETDRQATEALAALGFTWDQVRGDLEQFAAKNGRGPFLPEFQKLLVEKAAARRSVELANELVKQREDQALKVRQADAAGAGKAPVGQQPAPQVSDVDKVKKTYRNKGQMGEAFVELRRARQRSG